LGAEGAGAALADRGGVPSVQAASIRNAAKAARLSNIMPPVPRAPLPPAPYL
jgi:hypothetical protein